MSQSDIFTPLPRKVGVGDVRVSAKAIENVNNVLSTNRLSYGRYSKEFERKWADLHGRAFAVFVNSGTSALQIGLAAMKEKRGWPDGAEVLVPAVTFVASLNAIVSNRLQPVLVDVDDNWTMDINTATGDPRAVMAVHLFGHASPIDIGIPTIDDSCETVGMVGCADGEVSCFSTYACHNISTGVGGFATTDDPKLATLIRSLANHGRDGIYTGIDDELGRLEIIDARFKFDRLGYSYRATEMEAAIGCAEIDDWQANLAARKRNASYLKDALADLPLILPPWDESSWMMFPIRTYGRKTRDALVGHLEANGVETRPCLPLINQPYLQSMFPGDLATRYPVAHKLNETSFYVGCDQYKSLEDLEQISRALHSFRF